MSIDANFVDHTEDQNVICTHHNFTLANVSCLSLSLSAPHFLRPVKLSTIGRTLEGLLETTSTPTSD